ncbi:hypothetical protein NQ314_001268 [Rhamnusium bicolor]|uniref:Peptidyl-prolyl cis-trans isomerase n=1 Tax=Rhamnusium bicolor TaxID=1586634 RepID=A0AAV8ZT90_9CUCU|nr:hypothetical protein NQ314_001268 [Rhamnusium bicolor]
MVQGGDIINGTGTSGESIFGEYFEDEYCDIKHTEEGMVGMANNGPNTNHSQFYITTVPCSHLDDRNIIVGQVVKGLNIVVEMADIIRDENDRPLEAISIEDCGEFETGEPWNIEERDGTEDVYPPWPNDWDIDSVENLGAIINAINAIKKFRKSLLQKK